MSKKRLQFDFSEQALKVLDDVQKKFYAESRAETVRRALKLANRVLDKGVYIKNNDGEFLLLEIF